MPSLVAFGRKWNIGSDDFVFPELTEAFIRISWVAFGVSVFVFHFPLSCSTQNLNSKFVGLLVVNLITILLAILTAIISARGTIMDSNRRKLVPRLIYLRLPIFIFEIVLTVFSTIYAFQSTQGDAGCHFSTLVRVTIVLEWALILTAVIGIIVVFHLTENEMDDSATISQTTWSRRMRILKLGQDDSMRAALDDVALLISSFFVDSDLVFSDVVAGLLLAYHSPRNQYPPTVETSHGDTVPSWMNLNDAEYYLHHATCVYGWPTYMLANFFRPSGIWRLYRKLQCCGRMRCEQHVVDDDGIRMEVMRKPKSEDFDGGGGGGKVYYKGQSMVVEDNCCYCNTAAVVLANHQRNMDLVFMSFRNRVYETPFAVIADHEKKAIVVTIRGSCSLIDLVTDLCLEDEVMTIDVDQDATLRQDEEIDREGDVRVHRGMLRSARYVFEMLEKHRTLKDLFVSNPTYQLVVCGHSLGAGVGSLLTMLLKQEYPLVRCYAFSPPGCVISEYGQDFMEKYVMSVVSGEDIISRISYQSLYRLREMILEELMACKRPKYQILIRGVYQMFFDFPWEDDGLSGVPQQQSVDLESSLLQRANSYGGVDNASGSSSEDSAIGTAEIEPNTRRKIQLYVPGRVMHVAENEGETSWKWIDSKCLSDVKLSVSAMSDHLPAAVQRLLENAIKSDDPEEEIDIVTAQPI